MVIYRTHQVSWISFSSVGSMGSMGSVGFMGSMGFVASRKHYFQKLRSPHSFGFERNPIVQTKADVMLDKMTQKAQTNSK